MKFDIKFYFFEFDIFILKIFINQNNKTIYIMTTATATITNKTNIVYSDDMSEDMRIKALEITQLSFQKSISKGKVYSTIATRIQETFCKDYGNGWNCVVGKSFGSSVTHEIRTYA